MADTKITALTALTAADPANDVIPIVDVSDTTMAASGTTKKISVNNILSSSPTASGALTVTGLVTAGSATITGAATVGTTLGVTGQSTLTGNVGVGVTPSAWGAGLKALQVGATGYGALFDFNNDVIAMSANLLWTGSAYNRISASSKYALAYYQDIGGSHQWSMSSAAGTNAVAPTMNTLMTLNANGNLVLKGGTAAANGVGVTFPATQVAASDANTLDDYEEGTFTVALTFGGGSTGMTTSFSTGQYTKIGRQVSVNGVLVLTAKGSSTGAAVFSGLPFANANSLDALSAVSLRVSNISYVGSIQSLKLMNTSTFNIEQLTEAGSNTALSDANFSNSSDIAFNFTYNAA